MKISYFAILLMMAVYADETKWGVPIENGVSILTDDIFENFIQKHKFVLVKFYTPSCTHCKKMAKGYANLATKLGASEDLLVIVAQVDCTDNKETEMKYGITSYPTIKYFYHGIPIDVIGKKEEGGFEKWLKDRTGERAKEITTLKEFEELEQSSLAVVFYFPKLSTKLLTNLNALALTYFSVNFYFTYSDEIQNRLELEPRPSLIVLRSFDDGRKILSMNESMDFNTMKQFFESVRHPIVVDFTDENSKIIFNKKTTAVFFFTEDQTNSKFEIFKKIAQSRRGRFVFCKSGIKEGSAKKLAEYIGIHENNVNQVRIVKFVGDEIEKFKLEEVTEESLNRFLDDFENGKIEKYLKSAEFEDDRVFSVKIIIGDNFEKRVLESDKYVFLKIYAPWCKHCKEVEPIYKRLAEKLAPVKNLLIGEFEATANEHPSLNIKGFPTFKFYKHNDKFNPIEFTGKRTMKGFIDFLKHQLGDHWKHDNLVLDESL